MTTCRQARLATNGLLWVLLLALFATPSAKAQSEDGPPGEVVSESKRIRRAPVGRQIQFAIGMVKGRGIELGTVSARALFTRELLVLADIEPLWNETSRQARGVLMPGLSLRLFGFERLVGNAAYRGFDLDLGFRAGPGLSFSPDESAEDRNRRFELVLEPFLRFTRARNHRLAWVLESGITRPAVRLGFWIAL